MNGIRSLETLCTVCKTVVGVKHHYRAQLPDDFRVARHAVPGSTRARQGGLKQRRQICTGSGIVVAPAAVIPVEVGA